MLNGMQGCKRYPPPRRPFTCSAARCTEPCRLGVTVKLARGQAGAMRPETLHQSVGGDASDYEAKPGGSPKVSCTGGPSRKSLFTKEAKQDLRPAQRDESDCKQQRDGSQVAKPRDICLDSE